MKKLIAYSSVAHMGFVTMGLFSSRRRDRRGDVPDDLARPDLRPLFLCVGVIYDRMHTARSGPMGAS